MKQQFWDLYLLMVIPLVVIGCSGPLGAADTVKSEKIADCPDRPNCVSSEAQDADHAIAPLRLQGGPVAGWQAIREVVSNLPRCEVIKATDVYLHAECKSRIFRFVDDLELRLDPVTGTIAVRSASRIGYSDLGVNRRRVDQLRQTLKDKNLIH